MCWGSGLRDWEGSLWRCYGRFFYGVSSVRRVSAGSSVGEGVESIVV